MPFFKTKTLLNSSAEVDGEWFKLDTSFKNAGVERAFQISMNASDTITIEGTVLEADDATTLGTVAASDIATLGEYTGETAVNGVIQGTWTFIRATKTGANGAATVKASI